ncbi:MAG: glycerol-3-phosphate dehydrogenase subunit GlpB [Muribaculaceae bacterium]|nr:glycerol-3-phosphate dehydrogenase subunit GlpB [Muribaculaceae bacterium]
MKFDTIIIGGGLSGLTCGIALSQKGQRVAIVAGGQNSLHFNAGSMELLGNVDGEEIAHPVEAAQRLQPNHPYRKVGIDHLEELAQEAKTLLDKAGLTMSGNAKENHWRITPIGVTKPAWLTLEGLATVASSQLPWKAVTLVELEGFIDSPLQFVETNLAAQGVQVKVARIAPAVLTQARRSASEMRATSLAKILRNHQALASLAAEINQVTTADELVLMPMFLGLDDDALAALQAQVKPRLAFLPTLPPMVPGVRIATALQHYFKMLGGTYLLGDKVVDGLIEDNTMRHITTAKLQDVLLKADNFVLATGSFMSGGVVADFTRIYEPVFGLDVEAPANRADWTLAEVMDDQPYMSCGVATDDTLHALKEGKAVKNLFAIGSVLSGHNAAVQGDGEGVDMLTALAVAHRITNRQ